MTLVVLRRSWTYNPTVWQIRKWGRGRPVVVSVFACYSQQGNQLAPVWLIPPGALVLLKSGGCFISDGFPLL